MGVGSNAKFSEAKCAKVNAIAFHQRLPLLELAATFVASNVRPCWLDALKMKKHRFSQTGTKHKLYGKALFFWNLCFDLSSMELCSYGHGSPVSPSFQWSLEYKWSMPMSSFACVPHCQCLFGDGRLQGQLCIAARATTTLTLWQWKVVGGSSPQKKTRVQCKTSSRSRTEWGRLKPPECTLKIAPPLPKIINFYEFTMAQHSPKSPLPLVMVQRPISESAFAYNLEMR